MYRIPDLVVDTDLGNRLRERVDADFYNALQELFIRDFPRNVHFVILSNGRKVKSVPYQFNVVLDH